MISLKKLTKVQRREQGFTIVELLIVIVVIGILALLVITTYSGIQQKARNSQRQADIQAVQTQLEAYYQNNGYYPSFAHMNDANWRSTNMKSLDDDAVADPSAPNGTGAILNAPDTTKKQYAYTVTDSNNAGCEGSLETGCAQYTLTAQYEGTVNGKTSYAKKNLD